jgi:DHA2 family multidrug resistance protein
MPQLVRAVGLAFVFIPVSVAALSDISPEARGNATGLFNLTRELGGSIGTAWMGKVVADGLTAHGAAFAQHVTVYDAAVQQRIGSLSQAGLPALPVIAQQAQGQALVMSFEDGFRLAAIAILLSVVLVVMLKRARGAAPVGAH